MNVIWNRTLPRWASIGFAVFGFANIIGSLVKLSEMTFPGIVIGSVWATVGVMRGLPAFVTAPDSLLSTQDKITRGLLTIRRRRLFAFGFAFAWLPVAAIIIPQVPVTFTFTVFFMSGFLVGGLLIVWFLSSCPRCEQYFFQYLGVPVSSR